MSARFLLPTAALAVTAFAAACGGEENSTPVATTEVEMAKSYRFEPKAIRIISALSSSTASSLDLSACCTSRRAKTL